MQPTEYSLTRAYKRIENLLIGSMIRNLEKHKAEELEEGFNWDQWQVVQLRELERYRLENQDKFNDDFADIHKNVDIMFRLANEDGQTKEEAKILKHIKDGKVKMPKGRGADSAFFAVNDDKLDALIEATTNDLEKAEHAVLRKSNDIYRQVIFDAQVYAANGGTYEQAVDMATKDFVKRGITSVVYSNGSRHNIVDYASMALRTGNKRAYLMGEGKKHAKYGIHTVEVAKRQDACPLCLVWTGRVLIDDVYGGGTRQEAIEKNLPLLSTAMKRGFLHPNCRDVYSLYIPGVSKPAKPWTKEEIRDLALGYNLDQERKRAEDNAETWQRIADTRLDPDNKRLAEERVKAWKEKLDQLKREQEAFYGNKRPARYRSKSDGLLEPERAAINTYTSSEAYRLNEKLRMLALDPESEIFALTDEDRALIENLDAALTKMPRYNKEVYRSLESQSILNYKKFLEDHTEGSLVKYPAYTSAAKEVYDKTMDVQMAIEPIDVADIEAYNEEEHEVLFARDSEFMVTKRQTIKRPDGKLLEVIWLKQI